MFKKTRKPMKRHQVTRKTKSGKMITYWRGSGSDTAKTFYTHYPPKSGLKDTAKKLKSGKRKMSYSEYKNNTTPEEKREWERKEILYRKSKV